jgi:hypothetical protein
MGGGIEIITNLSTTSIIIDAQPTLNQTLSITNIYYPLRQFVVFIYIEPNYHQRKYQPSVVPISPPLTSSPRAP